MRLVCPAQGHFIFSHIADYVFDFCPISDPDVGLSVLVSDVEHTSFHFVLCGASLLCACSAPNVIAAGKRVAYTVSSGRGQFCFKEIPVSGYAAQLVSMFCFISLSLLFYLML